MHGTLPFGRPIEPRPPSAAGPRPLFVLGAYPSALHVRWAAPEDVVVNGSRVRIQALPVDNEPVPFWDGADAEARIDAWKAAVGWHDALGEIAPPGKLNGSSGCWLHDNVLAPLGRSPDDTWVTDCLDTYRASRDVARAVGDRFAPFASSRGLPVPEMLPHPSETAIVREALDGHVDRLRAEVETAQPDEIVTLGNAALRVLRQVVDGRDLPPKLDTRTYGATATVHLGGKSVLVRPLVHPGERRRYKPVHAEWMGRLALQ